MERQWTIGTIRIVTFDQITLTAERRTTRAYLLQSSGLAVSPLPARDHAMRLQDAVYWHITHTATGLRFPTRFWRRHRLMRMACDLADIADWTTVDSRRQILLQRGSLTFWRMHNILEGRMITRRPLLLSEEAEKIIRFSKSG